jgi:hypothetical protein
MRLLALFCSLILSISPFLPDNNNNALADLGLDAQVVSKEERDRIVEAMELARSTARFDTGGIQSLVMDSFDPEYFYVGFDDNITNGTYVECFTIDETYQYTISFDTYGTYEIFSYRGMLFIYFVREDWILAFDKNGNVTEVYELNNDSSVSNDEVLDSLCNRNKYTVDGKTFEVGNNSAIYIPFQTTYSNLKVTDQDGTSHYLYQTSESPFWASIGLAVFVFVIVLIMIQKQKEKKNDSDHSNTGN